MRLESGSRSESTSPSRRTPWTALHPTAHNLTQKSSFRRPQSLGIACREPKTGWGDPTSRRPRLCFENRTIANLIQYKPFYSTATAPERAGWGSGGLTQCHGPKIRWSFCETWLQPSMATSATDKFPNTTEYMWNEPNFAIAICFCWHFKVCLSSGKVSRKTDSDPNLICFPTSRVSEKYPWWITFICVDTTTELQITSIYIDLTLYPAPISVKRKEISGSLPHIFSNERQHFYIFWCCQEREQNENSFIPIRNPTFRLTRNWFLSEQLGRTKCYEVSISMFRDVVTRSADPMQGRARGSWRPDPSKSTIAHSPILRRWHRSPRGCTLVTKATWDNTNPEELHWCALCVSACLCLQGLQANEMSGVLVVIL